MNSTLHDEELVAHLRDGYDEGPGRLALDLDGVVAGGRRRRRRRDALRVGGTCLAVALVAGVGVSGFGDRGGVLRPEVVGPAASAASHTDPPLAPPEPGSMTVQVKDLEGATARFQQALSSAGIDRVRAGWQAQETVAPVERTAPPTAPGEQPRIWVEPAGTAFSAELERVLPSGTGQVSLLRSTSDDDERTSPCEGVGSDGGVVVPPVECTVSEVPQGRLVVRLDGTGTERRGSVGLTTAEGLRTRVDFGPAGQAADAPMALTAEEARALTLALAD